MTCHVSECVRTADLSDSGRYRFRLTRREPALQWVNMSSAQRRLRTVAWVMCNPSYADAEVDDATVKKVWGFSQRWGFSAVIVANTNPERSTDPRLQSEFLPGDVLERNAAVLRSLPAEASRIVVAWGGAARFGYVNVALCALLSTRRKLYAIEETASGQPCHPLMLPYSLEPFHWRPEV